MLSTTKVANSFLTPKLQFMEPQTLPFHTAELLLSLGYNATNFDLCHCTALVFVCANR